jgi:hypothetical protein
LRETADAAQACEKSNSDDFQSLRLEIQLIIKPVTCPIELLLTGKMGMKTAEQYQVIQSSPDALQSALQLVYLVDP